MIFAVRNNLIITILLLCFCIDVTKAQDTSNFNYNYVTVTAGDYEASSFMRFFAGDHWRDLWITPIRVPILNLHTYARGLTPTKKGGGQQTKSLHFIGGTGKEYKFRSIDKNVSRSLPSEFKGSVVDDALQDQISVTNPGSAVVISPLMEVVGILNTKPFICLMPDDEKLVEFRDEFAGVLGTIEEDPEDYENKELNFAGADKILSTVKLFEILQEDNDEVVDAAEFLKARLIDILIGDRDRHAGQWNWAGFKIGKKRVWKPIPKDRDFAFPLYDGLFPRLMTVAFTSMVNFGYDMPAMLDMTWEGRHLDRRFLGSLDKSVWDSITVFMQQRITDEVIQYAVAQLPPEYFALAGDQLTAKLKSRRDQLKKASDEFYNWVSKYVDVWCSDKDEYAEINRINNLFTKVSIYKRDKNTGSKNGSPIFYRLLKNTVSDEVRVHLMGGEDYAIVGGEVDDGIRVIIEGGKGKDKLYDSSKVNGNFLGFTPFPSSINKTGFYDSGKKTKFIESASTYINTDKEETPEDEQLRYEPPIEDRYHDYNVLIPFGFNTDDGIIFGLGGRINYYDFRMHPFSHRYDLSASYSTISERPEVIFTGDFNDFIRGINVKIPVKYTGLEITRFYGFGNQSIRDEKLVEEEYYNVSQKYFGVGSYFEIPVINHLTFQPGFLFEFSHVLKREGKLVTELNPYGLGSHNFFALSVSFLFDNRDDRDFPYNGYYFKLYSNIYPDVLNNKDFFGKLSFDGRSYLSSNYITDFTLALRTYSETAWGYYPFYKGATIGGKKTLRGFPRDRYVGDYSLMGSAELRFYLTKVFFLVPFKLGMNLFSDCGRVFLEGETSNLWHTSYGGGFWFSFNKRMINFSINYAKSPETFRIYLSLGQMF